MTNRTVGNLSKDMNARIDRLVDRVAKHMAKNYAHVDAHERAEKGLRRAIRRTKAAIAQLEQRAAHWQEIARTARGGR